MKKGVNIWCYPEDFTIEECMRIAKEAGFDGIEINMERPSSRTDIRLTLESKEKHITSIKKMAEYYGLEIPSISTSLCWRYSLCSYENDIREKGKDVVKKMIDAACILGADTVLVVPGIVDEVHTYKDAYGMSLNSLKELAPYAEQQGIYIGIENVWNKFLMTPLEMYRFIDEIGSPYVKVYFDIGNVVNFSYPEYWIEILGEQIIKVHVKDFKRNIGNANGFTNLLEGDVNWKRVLAALKKVNYDDYLTAELSYYNLYPEVLIKQTSIAMDAILKG